jgi:hypothetical protein
LLCYCLASANLEQILICTNFLSLFIEKNFHHEQK